MNEQNRQVNANLELDQGEEALKEAQVLLDNGFYQITTRQPSSAKMM